MDGLVMRTWLHVSSDLSNTTSFYSSTSKLMHKYYPITTLQLGSGKKGISKRFVLNDDVVLEGSSGNSDEFDGRNMSWVLKILQVGSLWNSAEKKGMSGGQNGNFTLGCDLGGSDEEFKERCSGGCGTCDDDDDDEGEVGIDKETFRKMLKKVPLGEAKLFVQLCYLGRLAYAIPIIKPRNMLKRYGLKYITSSIEKRHQLALADLKPQPVNPETPQESSETDHSDRNNSQIIDAEYSNHQKGQNRLNASAAIEIAASAAAFLHNHTKSIVTILPLKDSRDDFDSNSEMSSLRATTDSVTSVVAANEDVKQAVADDLNSMFSSPCEWYICDDHKTSRYFVIQGSETLASWQANLLFEPVQFEGLDVFVHRGIYEAAKGIYQQILPEVDAFLKTHGEHAKFRFTGHSLGGSLSMLINLMLLIRGVVPFSSLLPVVTFGSPCIMCGGDYLLHKLGLPKTHVQAIVMHRDIVPRVFSCYYPKPAAEFLKAVNGNFRNHPCLNNQKLLYAPMGEILILQPDSKHSPQHHLLPSYTGLFLLTTNTYEGEDAENRLRTAVSAFLNTPHPLEILNDRSAYGSDGTILRDHDISSYLKCLQTVVRLELSQLRKDQHKTGWYLRLPRVIGGTTLSSSHVGQTQFTFPRTGIKESLKHLTRLVKSQDMNSVLVFVGTYSMIDNGMRSQF